MPDLNFEGFEPQDIEMDTVPKGSLSGDDLLLGLFGSRKPDKHQFVTDPKKLSQVCVDELQRTRTDELRYTRTGELEIEEEKDYQSSQKQKAVENPLTGQFANQRGSIRVSKQTNTKHTSNEDGKRHKDSERNLNKLAIFAYEAEEGIEMLENGQNPFLEEVDRLLQEISSPEPFPKEVDQLFQ